MVDITQQIIDYFMSHVPQYNTWTYIHINVEQVAAQFGYSGNIGDLELAIRAAIPDNPLGGSLNVSSTPAGARVYIDNVDTQGVTPITIYSIPAGSHTVKLTLSGYQDWTGPTTISAGQTSIITAGLTPSTPTLIPCATYISQKGINLNSVSKPQAVQAVLDYFAGVIDKPCAVTIVDAYFNTPGATPITGLKWLCSGAPNYICSQSLDGIYNTQAECQAACTAPAPTTGSLNISSTPAGARVYIDNADQGAVTPTTIYSIPAGSHTVKLTLSGYQDWTGTANIVAGQTASISATLVPATPTLKWLCSGAPGIGCTQSLDGIYNTQADCQAACTITQQIINYFKSHVPSYNTWGYIHTNLEQVGVQFGYSGNWGTLELAIRAAIPDNPSTFPIPCATYISQQGINLSSVSKPQAVQAVLDYFAGVIDKPCAVSIVDAYFNTPGATPITGLKWLCSGAPNYICSQSLDGIYNTQAECQAACTAPAPTTGSLNVSSTPAGARVYIDNADQGAVTPTIINNIPAGNHTVKLTLSGYQDWTGPTTISAGQTSIITAGLTPVTPQIPCATYISQKGINLSSVPKPQAVQAVLDYFAFVIDKPCAVSIVLAYFNTPGATPIEGLKWLCSGAPDYTCSQSLDGIYNTQAECQAACTAPAPTAGSLNVSSTPAGARVYIDNADQGAVTPTTINNIPAGSHTVRLVLSGYQDWTGTANIVAGQTASITATLVPITPTLKWLCSGAPDYACSQSINGTYNTQAECQAACTAPNTGSLNVSSTPAGARVYVDNADLGSVTPAVITNLTSGNHTYRLVLSGYKDAAGTFMIASGQTTAVSVPMVKEEGGLSSTTLGLVAAVAFGVVVVAAVVGSGSSPDVGTGIRRGLISG